MLLLKTDQFEQWLLENRIYQENRKIFTRCWHVFLGLFYRVICCIALGGRGWYRECSADLRLKVIKNYPKMADSSTASLTCPSELRVSSFRYAVVIYLFICYLFIYLFIYLFFFLYIFYLFIYFSYFLRSRMFFLLARFVHFPTHLPGLIYKIRK